MSKWWYCVTAAAVSMTCGSTLQARELTFEDRVKAQEAIERVYYSHQIGAATPFEEAVPRSVLENKVNKYLGRSVIAKEIWETAITRAMLRRELDRMIAQTHLPQRLDEMFLALGRDETVILRASSGPSVADACETTSSFRRGCSFKGSTLPYRTSCRSISARSRDA